jgi:hypothetical protein
MAGDLLAERMSCAAQAMALARDKWSGRSQCGSMLQWALISELVRDSVGESILSACEAWTTDDGVHQSGCEAWTIGNAVHQDAIVGAELAGKSRHFRVVVWDSTGLVARRCVRRSIA